MIAYFRELTVAEMNEMKWVGRYDIERTVGRTLYVSRHDAVARSEKEDCF